MSGRLAADEHGHDGGIDGPQHRHRAEEAERGDRAAVVGAVQRLDQRLGEERQAEADRQHQGQHGLDRHLEAAPDLGLAGEPREGGGVERGGHEHRGLDQPVGRAELADVGAAGGHEPEQDDARPERERRQDPGHGERCARPHQRSPRAWLDGHPRPQHEPVHEPVRGHEPEAGAGREEDRDRHRARPGDGGADAHERGRHAVDDQGDRDVLLALAPVEDRVQRPGLVLEADPDADDQDRGCGLERAALDRHDARHHDEQRDQRERPDGRSRSTRGRRARRGSLAISRPTQLLQPEPGDERNTVLNDIAKMKSPNCSSPSSRAMTTKNASEATLPTASPASRASVPNAIRRDAVAIPSGSIECATLGDVPSDSSRRVARVHVETAAWTRAALAEIELPPVAAPSTSARRRCTTGRSSSRTSSEQVMAPLRARGVEIVHLDAKAAPGVDVVCDLGTADAGLAARLGEHALVLVCGVMQALRDPGRAADIAVQALAPGGHLVAHHPETARRSFDPVDHMLRMSPDELAGMFERRGLERVRADSVRIDDPRYYRGLVSRPSWTPCAGACGSRCPASASRRAVAFPALRWRQSCVVMRRPLDTLAP